MACLPAPHFPEPTVVTATLVVLWCLAGDPANSISTEELNAYAAQVVRARNACGPTAVWYCLRRLGHDVTLADVWRQADIGADGTSLQNLLDLLHAHGAPARALVGDPQRLDTLPPLSILVIGGTHCVVFEGLAGVSGTELQSEVYNCSHINTSFARHRPDLRGCG
jgi:hypothetical protein